MGPLTPSARDVLVEAAHFIGEPEARFSPDGLAEFMGKSHPRGLRGHSLPALARRGLAVRHLHPVTGRVEYELTYRGYDEAFALCGGRGLL